MPVIPDYPNLTQLQLDLRNGEYTACDLMGKYLQRIAERPGLNAFVHLNPELALEAAERCNKNMQTGRDIQPLSGIPFAIKDLFNVSGYPTQAGYSELSHDIQQHDAQSVACLRAAGMLPLGKTQTVQFAFGGTGINHDTGTPWNPWVSDEHYLPGGSSSGSAVAVAANLAPVALGTDTGGSVRIPASLCGLVGLKTTVGQVSRRGVYPLSQTLDSVGTITHCVEDAAFLFDVLQGFDCNDETTFASRPVNALHGLRRGIKGLRLAFAESEFWADADPEVSRAVRASADIFTGLGAEVSQTNFEVATKVMQINPTGRLVGAEAYANNQLLMEQQRDSLDPIVSSRLGAGINVHALEYLKESREWQQLRSEAYQQFEQVDALLVPTTALPALPVAEVDKDLDTYANYNGLYLRNTAIGNILNLCGISIPCGYTKKGLPIGLMIYVRPFHEDLVLRIAYAYEQATLAEHRYPAGF